MIDKNKQNDTKSGVSPVAAAVTGAVVGAGVTVAGVVALKDEKNRAKVKKVLNKVKDQAMGYIEDIQKQAEDKEDAVKGNLAEGKKEVKKITSEAKDARKTVQKS